MIIQKELLEIGNPGDWEIGFLIKIGNPNNKKLIFLLRLIKTTVNHKFLLG
jgi:hypothetical protein